MHFFFTKQRRNLRNSRGQTSLDQESGCLVFAQQLNQVEALADEQ